MRACLQLVAPRQTLPFTISIMSNTWPPPPDLASIQELLRAADPEGRIADGAPADESEPEERDILASIAHMPTAELLAADLLPRFEALWTRSFNLSAEALAERRPALLSFAKEIERFFGPESKPRTRQQILADSGAA